MEVKDKVVIVTGASSGIGLATADSADYIAEKIYEGIRNEETEIFAHDWMKKIG